MIQIEAKHTYTARLHDGGLYEVEKGQRLTYRSEIVTGDGVKAMLVTDGKGNEFYVPSGLFRCEGNPTYSIPVRLMDGKEHSRLRQDAYALLLVERLRAQYWEAYPDEPEGWRCGQDGEHTKEELHPTRIYALGYATRGLFGQPSNVTDKGDFFLSYAAKITMAGESLAQVKAYLAKTHFPLPDEIRLDM